MITRVILISTAVYFKFGLLYSFVIFIFIYLFIYFWQFNDCNGTDGNCGFAEYINQV